jgi:hypothetical protein
MDINELSRRLKKILIWVGQDNPIRHEVLDIINILKSQVPPDGLLQVEGQIIIDKEEKPIANTANT